MLKMSVCWNVGSCEREVAKIRAMSAYYTDPSCNRIYVICNLKDALVTIFTCSEQCFRVCNVLLVDQCLRPSCGSLAGRRLGPEGIRVVPSTLSFRANDLYLRP